MACRFQPKPPAENSEICSRHWPPRHFGRLFGAVRAGDDTGGAARQAYDENRLDTEYADRARDLGFKLKPSDYFRRQGYVTYQQDQFLEPIIPLIGEDNIIWGADYPHPDCIWPGSRKTLDRNMAHISPAVRSKITSENVTRLYQLHQ